MVDSEYALCLIQLKQSRKTNHAIESCIYQSAKVPFGILQIIHMQSGVLGRENQLISCEKKQCSAGATIALTGLGLISHSQIKLFSIPQSMEQWPQMTSCQCMIYTE